MELLWTLAFRFAILECLALTNAQTTKQMEKLNQDPVKFEDVKDEIFDMVRPKDSLRITLEDMVNCGNGDTVVSILIDLNGFWTYENREVLANDNAEEPATAPSTGN